MCTKIQTCTYTPAHTYTHSTTVKMKAAIILSNCTAGSSLFRDELRPHWVPSQSNIPLRERRCCAHVHSKLMCPFHLSFFFFWCKWTGWSQLHPRLTPDALCRVEDGILSSVSSWSDLFICPCLFFLFLFLHGGVGLGCTAVLSTLVYQLHQNTLSHSEMISSTPVFLPMETLNGVSSKCSLLPSAQNITDRSDRLGFITR